MNCLDSAEIPSIQPFDVDTFEDEEHLGNESDIGAMQICGFHPKTGSPLQAATPISIEEQELAWEQCSAVYNVALVTVVGVVILVHLAFLFYALWGAIKRACVNQTHLRTEGVDVVGEDETPLTYTPEYVWYVKDGKLPLKGLTQEDFIDFERYAHFVYAQSHES
ncbi:unnamed protein product [Hydatigera taeniaeformis]|uniref:Neural proliferation differentiation and control protein 1 n=1 Tax=Hydatigena taeniaeformis TaxID=6205 RepID=A0A0R3WKV6_HYDTA|nr:unnamed protein product [Hydatigera taeniaeformis]